MYEVNKDITPVHNFPSLKKNVLRFISGQPSVKHFSSVRNKLHIFLHYMIFTMLQGKTEKKM